MRKHMTKSPTVHGYSIIPTGTSIPGTDIYLAKNGDICIYVKKKKTKIFQKSGNDTLNYHVTSCYEYVSICYKYFL